MYRKSDQYRLGGPRHSLKAPWMKTIPFIMGFFFKVSVYLLKGVLAHLDEFFFTTTLLKLHILSSE
jgi:hypothetical protein